MAKEASRNDFFVLSVGFNLKIVAKSEFNREFALCICRRASSIIIQLQWHVCRLQRKGSSRCPVQSFKWRAERLSSVNSFLLTWWWEAKFYYHARIQVRAENLCLTEHFIACWQNRKNITVCETQESREQDKTFLQEVTRISNVDDVLSTLLAFALWEQRIVFIFIFAFHIPKFNILV